MTAQTELAAASAVDTAATEVVAMLTQRGYYK